MNAGAVLGGTGTIGGATTVSGSLSPGNSIGTLTVENDLTWNEGEAWLFELGIAGTSDLLDLTGVSSQFLKGTGSVFEFDFDGTGEEGVYTLVQWTSTTNLGGGTLGTEFELMDFAYLKSRRSADGGIPIRRNLAAIFRYSRAFHLAAGDSWVGVALG